MQCNIFFINESILVYWVEQCRTDDFIKRNGIFRQRQESETSAENTHCTHAHTANTHGIPTRTLTCQVDTEACLTKVSTVWHMVQALTNTQKGAGALGSVTHLQPRVATAISSRSNNEQWSTSAPSEARGKHIRKLSSIPQSNYRNEVIRTNSKKQKTKKTIWRVICL